LGLNILIVEASRRHFLSNYRTPTNEIRWVSPSPQ
jgi:hypothetical protein